MNSRERVTATVSHRQPDRVAIGPAFSREIVDALKARLGFQHDHEVWAWSGHDFAWIGPGFPQRASPVGYADPTIEVTADGLYLDIYRVPFKVVDTECQRYVELAGLPPLRDVQSVADLVGFPWPTADLWDYSGIPAALDANRDRATEGHSRGFFEIAHFMRGMDQFLVDLAADPELACAIMDRIIDHLLERARRMLAASAGGYVIFEYNDDVASQRGLFVSPEMWRRYQKPRMARFCALYHRYGAKVRYHSCGAVRAIIPDLVEIGVDILNPVQALAEGMDPFELKREFGRELTFHGGVDIQDFLIHATPQQVREHTRRLIDVVGKDGGLILAGSHCIQADTPVENVIALFETAKAP